MEVDLPHTDPTTHGDDGTKEFAVLAWVETDGGEFFVAFEGTEASYVKDEVVGSSGREPLLQDGSWAEALIVSFEVFFCACKQFPQMEH